nr:reverse transcriptase domain-containing protein [Tanacetum cinerariifolium]
MTSGREDSPPSSFSSLTPLPASNVVYLPPIIASTFTTRFPYETPLANCASTSANLEPVVRPALIEANYEALKSLLKDRRSKARHNEIRVELEYSSEECDDEIKMDPS